MLFYFLMKVYWDKITKELVRLWSIERFRSSMIVIVLFFTVGLLLCLSDENISWDAPVPVSDWVTSLEKEIRFLRNPEKRFRRPAKASEWIEMPKKRIFNSTEPLKVLPVYPWEEPFAKKPIFLLRIFKISFVKKFETFRASYETLKGFSINP